MFDRVSGEPRQFIQRVFSAAKKGRIWYSLNPQAFGVDRERVVRALHYLEEHGAIELRASEPRLRYTRVSTPGAPAALVATLLERFERRESGEIARLQQVLALVAEPTCQTAALVGYFGETLPGPCGHCTSCHTPVPRGVPPAAPLPPIAAHVNLPALVELRESHPVALGEPRQQARFLCGLTSPGLTAARLSRHPLFGALEQYPFAEVLAWCADPP
jgi:ATP-dependent DNA helicase RecQ